MLQTYLELGKIVNTHGVRGELKVDPWCDGVDFFSQFKTVYLAKQGKEPYTVLKVRPQGHMILLTLEGVTDLDAANLLRNKTLYVKRDDAKLEEGRYFVAELIGCVVSDADTGETYGKVVDVTNTGATDVWQIKGEKETYYMPVIPGILVNVNVAEEQVTVRPIPGIFGAGEEIR